jgi:hypothetical protein
LSELAYECFKENSWITIEEDRRKEELIEAIEQVMNAQKIECDNAFLKLPKEKHRLILTEARRILKQKKMDLAHSEDNLIVINENEQKEDLNEDQSEAEAQEERGEPIAA